MLKNIFTIELHQHSEMCSVKTNNFNKVYYLFNHYTAAPG